ncbi:ROK family transcriptional regulator [Nakamurella flavida]|uniref:ROK family transcriptional regulator n=1 Tax=Nakamurella flavida TaxID=363630 RepID=A0A938YIT1_9ACTN|nr:ROK family transcriptional regulator [Nakamurella flavida]MBM9475518.1 ROK family transcriptional regulator [Nakamurella flavida]MDP9778207.1 putative NBD/HSP70 family sugar kinase [Nakamurella flavida]
MGTSTRTTAPTAAPAVRSVAARPTPPPAGTPAGLLVPAGAAPIPGEDRSPRVGGSGEVFQFLRDGRPRTRSELISLTGLARSTVGSRLDALLDSGLITLAGEAGSTGGRPPAVFAFRPASRVVLAVDLGAVHARLALTDLASTVLAQVQAPLLISAGPAHVLDWVGDQAEALLAQAGRSAADLMGIGVGLPGPVEHATGRPINPPIMPGWDDADVRGILAGRFGCAALIDNDVNIMALGEYRTAWNGVSDMMFVKLATGIGSGIIADGQLRRGAQGAAGDIGHVAVPGGPDVPCRCGNTGCLEAVASGRAVAEALTAEGIDASNGADVVALVRAGDVHATQAVREAGRRVGAVLATCVNLLNPSVIAVGGVLAEAGEHLLAGIREVVYRRSVPLASQHLRIVGSVTGPQAGVIGASVMALDHVLSADAVDDLVS